MNKATTLGALKKSGYVSVSIKQEMRNNLIEKLEQGLVSFPGIFGYDDTVIPETERAILSQHNILYLGLRGQAKTRMARQMVHLLDEYIPIIKGSPINDDPFNPLSKYAKNLIEKMGDDTPIEWLHRNDRYLEKLATPDVSVADLIGDIDPIKAANLKLSFADEEVIHYGIVPRSNRCIFVINELPDLQARIQVSLFNILEEGDLQIRGFKLRLPLDIQFVFTANPEDYTNRGSIVTPLKDRIQSQILTHYPKNLETALQITQQEVNITSERLKYIAVSDIIKRLIEQIAFEARSSEMVDKKSGVSARLTLAAFENVFSTAERRKIINKEKQTQIWITDVFGAIPGITGKIELVYEGEQEGSTQVAFSLLDKSIRSLFADYFPSLDSFKKRKKLNEEKNENPYAKIIAWFDKGEQIKLLQDVKDETKLKALYSIEGLSDLVKKYYPKANKEEAALLMEFLLFGLSSFSLISRKMIDGVFEFNDLMSGMLSKTTENNYDDY